MRRPRPRKKIDFRILQLQSGKLRMMKKDCYVRSLDSETSALQIHSNHRHGMVIPENSVIMILEVIASDVVIMWNSQIYTLTSTRLVQAAF